MRKRTETDSNMGVTVGIGTVLASALGAAAFGPVGLLLGAGALVGGAVGKRVETKRLADQLERDVDDEAQERVIHALVQSGKKSGIVTSEFDFGDRAPLLPWYTTKVRRTTRWSSEDD